MGAPKRDRIVLECDRPPCVERGGNLRRCFPGHDHFQCCLGPIVNICLILIDRQTRGFICHTGRQWGLVLVEYANGIELPGLGAKSVSSELLRIATFHLVPVSITTVQLNPVHRT
jgi:hypothetical protein